MRNMCTGKLAQLIHLKKKKMVQMIPLENSNWRKRTPAYILVKFLRDYLKYALCTTFVFSVLNSNNDFLDFLCKTANFAICFWYRHLFFSTFELL